MSTTNMHLSRQRGAILLATLVIVALFSLGSLKVLRHVGTDLQRENEQQLAFVGGQFERAIRSYYYASQGPNRELPQSLEDLLEDPRTPYVKRHLRKIYNDPISTQARWGVIHGVVSPSHTNSKDAPDSKPGIIGIYSLAQGVPFRKTATTDSKPIGSYAQWQFLAFPSVSVRTSKGNYQ